MADRHETERTRSTMKRRGRGGGASVWPCPLRFVRVPVEWARVVGHRTTDRKATEGANREGYRGPRREAYFRRGTIKSQGGGTEKVWY